MGALCDSETWEITEGFINKVDAVEMSCRKPLRGVSWIDRLRNEDNEEGCRLNYRFYEIMDVRYGHMERDWLSESIKPE